MYITANLMGGLGNQLFQIFVTFAHAIEIRYDVIFTYDDTLYNNTNRHTYWTSFLSNLVGYTSKENNNTRNQDIDRFYIYREPRFQYSVIPHFTQQDVKLFGYFQSYKYFEYPPTFEKICDVIDVRAKQAAIKTKYENFFPESRRIISMHFRLGDYKHIQDCHPLMPYEYYDKALSTTLARFTQRCVDQQKFRVNYFCEKEDNDTVENMIRILSNKYSGNVDFYKVDDNIDDWKQLLLMSCCHDNIIANSSFSWWAAYFNRCDDKCVCYPGVWFGPSIRNDVSDLFPDVWCKISV